LFLWNGFPCPTPRLDLEGGARDANNRGLPELAPRSALRKPCRPARKSRFQDTKTKGADGVELLARFLPARRNTLALRVFRLRDKRASLAASWSIAVQRFAWTAFPWTSLPGK